MSELPYKIFDADNHFTEPPTLYQDYIDPSMKDMAITFVEDASGKQLQLFAGKPSKFTVDSFGENIIAKQVESGGLEMNQEEVGLKIPGKLLNRLNPLKGLDADERKAVIEQFRHMSEAYGNRDLRLALMDEQGIEAALMFPASAHDIEFEFAD